MLRAIAIAVVAMNLLFFGYTRGWFDGVFGLDSSGGREPDRLLRQIRPETLRVTPGAASAPASDAAVAAGACLESPALAESDAQAAEATLRGALPVGRWIEIRTTENGATTRRFRVEAADAALTTKLAGLKLDAAGRFGFSPCATTRP